MIFCRLPLADENCRKKSDEGKIQAFGIDLQTVAQETADGCARYPVDLVQQIYADHEAALVDAFGDSSIAVDGEGFITHTEDQIKLFQTGILIFFQHAQAVEQMTRINHQRHKKAVQRIEGTKQHCDQNEFHAAGKDKRTGEKRIPGRKALAADIKAVGDA